MVSQKDPNCLSTWKEIAVFLSCDVRTCMRWEKERGLPVHRPEGGSKARVYAWKDELEAWLKRSKTAQETGVLPPADKGPGDREKSGARRPGKMHPMLLAAAVVALAVGLFFGYQAIFFDRNPDDFHIKGSVLQIVNKSGKQLWIRDTQLKLDGEEQYRPFFNGKGRDQKTETLAPPLIIIRDIDNDGFNEVLFTPKTRTASGAGRVTCFDHRGVEKWRFEGGRKLAFGGQEFSGDFWCRFDVDDFNGDGRNEILVLAANSPRYPSQVVLLSNDGKMLGEYWNSGRILDYLSADLNGDGRKELAVCGTNNEYRRGVVAILDPGIMNGASPNTSEFSCPDLSAGTELAYLILPKTDVDPIHPETDYLNFAVDIELKSGRIYLLTMENKISFEIDPKTLACRNVGLSNEFKAFHEAAAKAGRVSSVLDGGYYDNLRTSLEYWTGSKWTTTPTWIR